MTCKHSELSSIEYIKTLNNRVSCPICLHEKLAQAMKVIEAAERYKQHVEFYFAVPKNPDCNLVSEDLRAAIANLRSES